jgi:hypothetical protein
VIVDLYTLSKYQTIEYLEMFPSLTSLCQVGSLSADSITEKAHYTLNYFQEGGAISNYHYYIIVRLTD